MVSKNKKNIFKIIQAIIILAWLILLLNTDSYYSIYLLLGAIGLFSLFFRKTNFKNIPTKKDKILMAVFSCVLSLAIVLANYTIFENIFTILLSVVGGFFVAYNILELVNDLLNKKTMPYKTKMSSTKVFYFCFTVLAVTKIAILLLCYRPGILSPDSIDEISQMYIGNYSNHHPFYFTIFVQLFLNIGTNIFGNTNAGILTYTIAQIIIMSAIFSFGIMTMYQQKIPKIFIILAILLYGIMPYHIMYSFTIWKDVLFGGFTLLFLITLYRSFRKDTSLWNFVFMAIGCFGICLFRSNGWAAFILAAAVFIIIFRKKHLDTSILFIMVSILSFILKGPVLAAIGVSQPDTIESLSIPTQQIARVIVDNKESLTDEQIYLINNVVDIEKIATAYDPKIHDPVKNVIRVSGNQSYIGAHKKEFIKLYLQLGINHPVEYIKAWTDQTRGYWNGGYVYWIWQSNIVNNAYNINSISDHKQIEESNIFQTIQIFQPLISIGFHVWILWLFLYIGIKQYNKNLIFATIPLLAIWGTLLIATPVFSEFRYIYSMFCCLPFLPIFISYDMTSKKGGNICLIDRINKKM